eukprot:4391061-Prymnesium_polylepis.1
MAGAVGKKHEHPTLNTHSKGRMVPLNRPRDPQPRLHPRVAARHTERFGVHDTRVAQGGFATVLR